MRKNIRMSFDCMYFSSFVFFAFTWNKISDVIGLNRFMYLHLNQLSSELVYLKNHGIKILLLKNFCQLPKAKPRCQLDPLILFSAGVGKWRSAGLN